MTTTTTLEAAKSRSNVFTKEQLQITLGCGVCRADTDNEYYRNEDLEWVCTPTTDDPGVTGPKSGATPAAVLMLQQQ